MATLHKHGSIIGTYLSLRRRGLIRHMGDGTVLLRSPFQSGWKIYAKRKPGLSDDDVRAMIATLPSWRRIDRLPSFNALQRWASEGMCETPSGDSVEPDGRGPDGVPSWLLIFGLI